MDPPQGKLERFLLKDEGKKLVSVYRRPVPNGKSAVTLYRTLQTRGELSLVEAELADAGHPLLGDGKYGKGDVNRRYGETRQALCSYYLRFDFPTDAGMLQYLQGRTFQVPAVPFADKYFPDAAPSPGGRKNR